MGLSNSSRLMTEAQDASGFYRHCKHWTNCHSNASRQSDVCMRNQLHFILIASFHQTVDNMSAYHISLCSSHAIALCEAAVVVGRALMHTCTRARTHTNRHAERKELFKMWRQKKASFQQHVFSFLFLYQP